MQCVYEFQMQEPVLCHSLGESFIASGSLSKVIRLADLTSGSMTHTLFGHSMSITSLKWMPGRDKLLASASLDGTIRVWDVRMANSELFILNHQIPSLDYGERNRIYCNSLIFSPDGSTLYASGNDDRISVWNIYSGSSINLSWKQKVYHHTNKSQKNIQMAINEHGFLFHPSDDGRIYIYDMSFNGHGNLIANLEGHLSATFCLAVDPNGKLYSASLKDGLYKWDCKAVQSVHNERLLSNTSEGAQDLSRRSSSVALDDLILGEWDEE